jgi:AraC-like DNA-binding protein
MYLGRSFDSGSHTHHAVQLTIGLDGPLRINRGIAEEHQFPAVVIDSDIPHKLKAEGQWVASIYLEPESDDFERLVRYYSSESGPGYQLANIAPDLKEQLLELLTAGLNADRAYQLLNKLIEPSAAEQGELDARVIRVLRYLNKNPGLNVPIGELAQHVNLSPDRLAHLFRDEIGIPIRRYILWQKLRLAASAACDGQQLTDAAQHGGFSDSAHFTHSFQKLFGINPSFLFGSQNQLAVYIESDLAH